MNYDSYLAHAIEIFNDKMDADFSRDNVILTCFMTDDQEEIADTDNNCEVSAVGIPQDFQLDFPRLMGTERIYCPEETIQKRAAR